MKKYVESDIAVAILNWNGQNLLKKFLPSIQKNSGEAKVYIIDNASSDDSVAYIKDNFPSIEIIQLSQNLGYAGGYNEGIKQIPEAIVCCLNSDVEVGANWLLPILESFNKEDSTAVVQPKILDYHKKDTLEYAGAAGGFIDSYGYPFCRGRVFDWIDKDRAEYSNTMEVFWASGACFFIRKDYFISLGGFDPEFFAHMEEIDLCWRAFNLNYKVIYQGRSEVFHIGGSTLKNSSPKKTFLNFRNSLFAITKNTPSPFKLVLIRLVLDGVAGCRFLLKLQLQHLLAILHAHLSFYSKLPYILKERKKIPKKRRDYFKVKSIVWSYFISKKTVY
jgi:GT2 family glycosyltransferase